MAQYIIPGAGFFDDGLDQRSYMAPGGGVVNEAGEIYSYIVDPVPFDAATGLSSSVCIQVAADDLSVAPVLDVADVIMARFLDLAEVPLSVQNSASASLGFIIPAVFGVSLSGVATPALSLTVPVLETTHILSVGGVGIVTVVSVPALSVSTTSPAPTIEIFILPSAMSANPALSATPIFAVMPPALSVIPAGTTGEIMQVTIIVPDPLGVNNALTAAALLSVLPPSMDIACSMTAYSAIELLPAALQTIQEMSVAGSAVFIDRDYQITYECGLTEAVGDMAGLITFPISSFQARSRVTVETGSEKTIRTFLSVVIPGMDNAEEIAACAGDIIVWMVKTYRTGETIKEIIFCSQLDNIRLDEGASSQSITLSGISDATVESKEITLSGASYYCLDKGNRRYRCRPEIFLRCGDTAQINGDTLIVGDMTWYCGVGQEILEIAEA